MSRKEGTTILIVEDDPGTATLQQRRLARAGYVADTAANTEQALAKLAARAYSLLLLDYRLADGTDGLALCQRLKNAGHDVPVVLVTGFSDEATVIRALRAGVRDFVPKSVEYLDYLPEAVERVLRQTRTEQELAASRAQLAGIIESAKDAILVTEADRRITLFNRAAEQMFRCTAAEALGQPLGRFIPRDMSPTGEGPDETSVTNLVREGSRGIRADGSEFPLEASYSRVEVGGRKVYTVVVRDVTERRRAEEALRESEELYRNLVETSPDAILLADLDGTIRKANRQAALLFGFAGAEALVGRNAGELVAPESRDHLAETLRGVLEKGGVRNVECVLVRQDGSRFPAESSAEVVRDSKGQPRGFLGVLRDITARAAAQAKLREQAALLAKATDAILVEDLDDRITFFNPRAERLYGWTAAEALGRNAAELLYKPGQLGARDEARRILHEKDEWKGELRQTTKSEKELIVESHWTLVRDEQGRATGKLVINTDVTDKKKLEAQLLQAQRMESVGVLAGGVAHDFNNMLTVITGCSEIMLGRMAAGEAGRDLIEEIRKAGERAALLTRQLLAFSRKQILRSVVLDLNVLIQDMEKLLRRLIGEDIDVAAVLCAGGAWVRADPGQLQQVIMNLVVNARDAMPTGGRLTVATHLVDLDAHYAEGHPDARPGPYVLLAVTDTGHGMDEATKVHIFEPFFTTKGVGVGTGLGLATVYGVVKQSGGSIEVYSEPGHGTVFKIYLPHIDEKVALAAPAESPQAPRGRETVLLAEDEEGVRSIMRLALSACGYTVLESKNTDEAIRMCREQEGQIHLLVTDVVMPKLSGRQLADLLSAMRPTMKVLYVSGYTDDSVVRHGVLAAGMAFLQKPFAPLTLAKKVREVLDQ
jgi:PAS domain S-box-containing protein